jgi:xanthosine utilization system XapX-like protein
MDAVKPNNMKRGTVKINLNNAKQILMGKAFNVCWFKSNCKPNAKKKIATPKLLMGSIFDSMWSL